MYKTLSLVFVLSFFFVACTWMNQKLGFEDDNLIEEAIEEVIENELGIKIDITVDSPECP